MSSIPASLNMLRKTVPEKRRNNRKGKKRQGRQVDFAFKTYDRVLDRSETTKSLVGNDKYLELDSEFNWKPMENFKNRCNVAELW